VDVDTIAVPGWFRRALAEPFRDEQVEVEGAAIHYLAWGPPGRPGLVFVHGGGAHAHWWTHVAAPFATEFRVLALDLSGHGDSDHRPEYSLDLWTAEVMAVAGAGGINGRPLIVGHSMGGFVTIATAALHSDRLAGAVVCDSPVTAEDPEVSAARIGSAFGAPRTYPTLDAALARFRTVPPQAHYLDYVVDNVARHSVRRTEGGWRWKFDRQVFAQLAGGAIRSVALPYLADVRCRLALLRSEYGLVTADIGADMYDQLGRVTPIIEIPEAGHHAMLDQPLLLLTALRTLVADWAHSEPHRRTDDSGVPGARIRH
jgi:pimeloyl-ACP methyl ester carboxylesterase